MKLIKTFMAAALLSTAFAGMAFAAEHEADVLDGGQAAAHGGQKAAVFHGLGFGKDSELDDVKPHLGLTQNAELENLTNLNINADLAGKLAEDKTEYSEEDVKSLVANEAKLYAKLVEKAGSIEAFKEIVAKKKPFVNAFKLVPGDENLGLGKHLNDLLAQFVADPFAALVDTEIAKEIQKLHADDEVRKQYQHLLAARASDEVLDKEDAARKLKAFLEETAAGEFEVEGQKLDFAGYVKAETTPISVADHRAKLEKQAEAHRIALDSKKAAPHETAGGALIENFIANASKLSSLKSNKAFKALNLESFTKANLKKANPAALGEAILGSIIELLESATNKDLQIADLQKQLETKPTTKNLEHSRSNSFSEDALAGDATSALRDDFRDEKAFSGNTLSTKGQPKKTETPKSKQNTPPARKTGENSKLPNLDHLSAEGFEHF